MKDKWDSDSIKKEPCHFWQGFFLGGTKKYKIFVTNWLSVPKSRSKKTAISPSQTQVRWRTSIGPAEKEKWPLSLRSVWPLYCRALPDVALRNNKPSFVPVSRDFGGRSRGEKTRTSGPYVPNVVRYQLRYTPKSWIKFRSAKIVIFFIYCPVSSAILRCRSVLLTGFDR